MNLDELRSVRDRERRTDSLQDLRASFYADAREYIRELYVEREQAVEAADDPFGSPEVRRLTDDIETAEQTLEDIYERRVGKVVEKASFAAADMPTDDGELTAEEHRLFETLVGDIRENRERVLSTRDADDGPTDEGTDGDADARTSASASEAGPTEPSDGPPQVDAADLMGESKGGRRGEGSPEPDAAESESHADPEPAQAVAGGRSEGAGKATETAATGSDVERATVRITQDVGEILGVDQRAYHLASEDVVTLPEANAEPLVERGAAERID